MKISTTINLEILATLSKYISTYSGHTFKVDLSDLSEIGDTIVAYSEGHMFLDVVESISYEQEGSYCSKYYELILIDVKDVITKDMTRDEIIEKSKIFTDKRAKELTKELNAVELDDTDKFKNELYSITYKILDEM